MTTAQATAQGGIDLRFVEGLQESSGGSRYAALQPDTKQPTNPKQVVRFGILKESLALLEESTVAAIQDKIETVNFDEDEVELCIIKPEVRFIICRKPIQFKYDRNAKEFLPSDGSPVEKGSGICTACKLHLGIVVDGKLLVNAAGEPEILTLKLLSMNMGEFLGSAKKSVQGDGTLYSLNVGLQKFYEGKTGRKLTGVPFSHLVHVPLKPVPILRKSDRGNSWAVKYTMGTGAKELDVTEQEVMHGFITKNDEFIADYTDPFGISRKSSQSTEEPSGDSSEQAAKEEFLEAIPF
ncbi:MAG: hypothetical protein ACRDBG_09825 [Waterburya sp.]